MANDSPKKILPPRVPIGLGTHWKVTISAQPQTKGKVDSPVSAPESVFYLPEPPRTCGSCGRTDTRCIHHDRQESLAGKWEELEYHCPACNWFTFYDFQD